MTEEEFAPRCDWEPPRLLQLIAPDPDPLRTIMRAARFSRGDYRQIVSPANLTTSYREQADRVGLGYRMVSDEEAVVFVADLIKRKHFGVLEHVTVTAVVRCSRVCSHQFVRARIASYLQESQRHVEPLGFVRDFSRNAKFLPVHKATIAAACIEAMKTYKELLELGCPKEDARYVLPEATLTTFVATKNLRSWRNFIDQRLRKDAQDEILSETEFLAELGWDI